MKHINLIVGSILLLVILPGCDRYIGWGKDILHQAQAKQDHTSQITRKYVRSLRIYDQLRTLGLFDILWLSDEVRILYSQEHTRRHGYSQERYKMFVRRQLAENSQTISFYILASMPHTNGIGLTDEQTPWTMYLNIDGKIIHPLEIKSVELVPAYANYFGKTYTQAKNEYELKFAARDVEGKPYITENIKQISLCFHIFGKKDEVVTWHMCDRLQVIELDPNNPDYLAYDLFDPVLV